MLAKTSSNGIYRQGHAQATVLCIVTCVVKLQDLDCVP